MGRPGTPHEIRTLIREMSSSIEILTLRHQLSVLQRSQRRRVALRTMDRLLWISLARFGAQSFR